MGEYFNEYSNTGKNCRDGVVFFSYRVTFTADRCKLKTTAIRPINTTGPYIFFLEMKFPMIVTKDLPDTVEVK